MIRRILSNEKKHFEVIFDLFPEPTIITTMKKVNWWLITRPFLKIIETRGKAILTKQPVSTIYILNWIKEKTVDRGIEKTYWD